MAKIFISHSSKDKEIIDLFKNKILNGGVGIVDDDIAYTSAVETGVPIGTNIHQYIKDNIESCDFVFFMISENYRKSEVCLNEMGAAWALDKCVKIFIIEDISFDSIGWLYSHNLGAKISDGEQLDSLRDELLNCSTQKKATNVWNRCKAEFIDAITEFKQSSMLPAVIKVAVENAEVVELGLLDYWDLRDEEQTSLVQKMGYISTAILELNDNTSKRTAQLNAVNQTPLTRANRSHIRGINTGFAKEMDQLSSVIEANVDDLLSHFDKMFDYTICMNNITEVDDDTRKKNRTEISEFMIGIVSAKDSIIEFKNSMISIINIEQVFNVAKNRLVQNTDNLIGFLDGCLARIPELLK